MPGRGGGKVQENRLYYRLTVFLVCSSHDLESSKVKVGSKTIFDMSFYIQFDSKESQMYSNTFDTIRKWKV